MSANNTLEAHLEHFPVQVELEDGHAVELRLITPQDRDAILAFAAGLPERDLLFLRVDITKPQAVDHWLANVASGATLTLGAFDKARLIGYATVDTNPARWTRRMGELRLNVGPDHRSKGLGRQLSSKIFDIARSMGLKKLTAHMTPGQQGAQAAFQRLGFVAEALLADCVEDRQGNLHDLIIMSYDVDGLTTQVDQPLQL